MKRCPPPSAADAAWRTAFQRLLNAHEDAAMRQASGRWLATCLAQAAAASQQADAALPCPASVVLTDEAAALTPCQLAYHAPLGLLEGAWLQTVATAANNSDPVALALFAAYLALLGSDEASAPAFAYRAALQRHGLAFGPLRSGALATDARIGMAALRHACVQLALGLHAAERTGEVLGYTLAYLRNDCAWRLPALSAASRRAVLHRVAAHTEQALQAFSGEPAAVWRGMALFQAMQADYHTAWADLDQRPPPASAAVAALFQRKLRWAQGYHPHLQLGGRSMDAWCADAEFDAVSFLAAFAASPYAARPDAATARPFMRLTGFGRPMFGVFSTDELALIEAWLDTPRHTDRPAPAPAPPAAAAIFCADPPALPPPSTTALPRRFSRAAASRHLFPHLLQTAPSPPTASAAHAYVERILCRARRARALNFPYRADRFAAHIAALHQRAIDQHRPFQPPTRLRRADYIWLLRQFAPAVLVDGSWLQAQGEAANQDCRLQRLLLRIYFEELGEGRRAWNHPVLYRDLLAEVGIVLPPTASPAFAADTGLMDSAFDLPAYLLAIAHWPRRYLAETLGLNLAIELSGLGAGYLRLAAELQYHAINPLIVKLHLSIDNLAGGHAALAVEAIQLYLDAIGEHGGEPAVQREWRRVASGYASLHSATRRFKWALLGRLCAARLLPNRLYPV